MINFQSPPTQSIHKWGDCIDNDDDNNSDERRRKLDLKNIT